MTETETLPPTPSEKTTAALGRLHLVTRLLVLAAVLHLVGDLPFVWRFVTAVQAGSELTFDALSQMVQAIGYSLTFIGGAASFEYVVRIWRELKLIRAAVDRSGATGPAAE